MKRRKWSSAVGRAGQKRRIRFAGFERLEERSLMAVGASPIVPGSMTPVVVKSQVAEKIGYDLAWLSADYQLTHPATTQSVHSGSKTLTIPSGSTSSFTLAPDQPNASLLDIQNGSVVVDTTSVGMDTTALRSELAGIGSQITGTFGRMVSARVPLASLGSLASLPDLQFARAAARPMLSAGKVDDQAVQAMSSDVGMPSTASMEPASRWVCCRIVTIS